MADRRFDNAYQELKSFRKDAAKAHAEMTNIYHKMDVGKQTGMSSTEMKELLTNLNEYKLVTDSADRTLAD